MVFDLEDAVSPADKEAARSTLAHTLATLDQPCIVRVNPVGSPWRTDDMAMIRRAKVEVMLPKAEFADQIAGLGLESAVIALIETPLGVVNACSGRILGCWA